MKIKLSKYIAKMLVSNGITQVFSVVGGGAMHLNDGLGHEPGLKTLYMHHEQACAIAAESYARIYNKPACLCVTTGPGGTNAITGVVGAWLDSIPMIVLSGQVRYDNTARWSGTGIRAMGDQEFDILRSVDCMTKYSGMVLDPMSIRKELEKCIYLAQTGRPGPCWLDIPMNVQGAFIEENALEPFDPAAYEAELEAELERIDEAEELAHRKERGPFAFADLKDDLLEISFRKQKFQSPPEKKIDKDSIYVREIIDRIRGAKRPVFYTGNGIRIAGAEDIFLRVADKLAIPVVVGWNGIDIIPGTHPLYTGQPGGRGDRIGNFAVQNADLILSVGSRLNIRQVGYNFRTWAREAYTIVCDIDEEELKKPSVHIDVPIHADAYQLLKALDEKLTELGYTGHGKDYDDSRAIADDGYYPDPKFVFDGGEAGSISWWEMCGHWKHRYPVYSARYAEHDDSEPANVYEFYHMLSGMLNPNQITVVGNGTPCVAGSQSYLIKDGSRFISQDAIASMGYDLPAAIGAAAACHKCCGETFDFSEEPDYADRALEDKAEALGELETAHRNPWWKGKREAYPPYYEHDIICHTGDGSIMMNLQELQTIVSHRMPIKMFLINNGGYHSIRQSQSNMYQDEPLIGVGVDSRDLSFPSFERIAAAFGIPYVRAEHNSELKDAIGQTLMQDGPVLCEIFASTDQPFEPRSAVRKHPDGTLSSPPLEDLAPFLSPEELQENMLVPPVKE